MIEENDNQVNENEILVEKLNPEPAKPVAAKTTLKSTDQAAPPEKTHFSVFYNCRIGNEMYRPSICYDLTKRLRQTVLDMESANQAKTYYEKVRFVSGKAYPAKIGKT